MKSRKLMLGAFCAAILAAGLVGCEDDLYKLEVNSPEGLQNQIDSIAAIKASAVTGDTTYIEFATKEVGEKDCSSGWWTVFSDYFQVPAGKKLHLEFLNYSSGASNWNNWNLCAANAERDADGYGEYFVIRSDNYGWGSTTMENGYDAALLSVDYFEEGKAADWASWLAVMNGAYVTMEIDHSSFGPTYVTVSQVGTDGITYTESFTSEGTTAATIYTWLICDGSYFEMQNGYIVPSEVLAIEDVMPTSITVAGTPTTLEIGDEDFWGEGVATVTFADGTSIEADTADITFVVVPDMTTVGAKTVTVAYSKSKQGNYCQAVATFYSFTVTAPVTSIEVSTIDNPTYYYAPGTTEVTAEDINPASYIKAVLGKTSTDDLEIPTSEYTVEVTTVPATLTDSYVVTVTYGEFTTTFEIALAQMESTVVSLGGITLGAEDNTAGWWAVHTPYTKVEAGTGAKFTFTNYSSGANNWNNFLVVLTNGLVTIGEDYSQTNLDGYAEMGVFRADNYGWAYTGDVVLESNHDWDNFIANLNGAKVTVEVINYGATCDVLCTWTGVSDNVEYYQNYKNIAVTDDLYVGFTTEAGHLVFE